MRDVKEMVQAIKENGSVMFHTPTGPQIVTRVEDLPGVMVQATQDKSQIRDAREMLRQNREELERKMKEHEASEKALEIRLQELQGEDSQEFPHGGKGEELPGVDIEAKEEDTAEESEETKLPTRESLMRLPKARLVEGAKNNLGLTLSEDITKEELVDAILKGYAERDANKL